MKFDDDKIAPMRLLILSIALGGFLQSAHPNANAQTQTLQQKQSRPMAPIRQVVPDENTLARLVWSTMVALDNANRTDNYAILNRLGSVQFQRRNSPEDLSRLFANLRANRVDVGRTILMTPTYYRPPEILNDGTLRLRGGFEYRPNSIRFDLIYSNVGGGWRISAISVVEMDAASAR